VKSATNAEKERVREVPPSPTVPLGTLDLLSFSGAAVPASDVRAEIKSANTVLKMQSTGEEESKRISFVVSFRVEAIHPANPSTGFFVAAKYKMGWTVPDFQPWPATEEDRDALGEGAVIRVVWPLWRELVLSATARLGFPPLTLPLVFTAGRPAKTAKVRHTKEWADKSRIVEKIKMHFEHDSKALIRDNRLAKMYALMTTDELEKLASDLDVTRKEKKVSAVVSAIVDAREARGEIGRRIYDDMTG
jgi:preprotein translocase subunit SecB